MAYLNVRDRRIETKIAYVGPGLAGKSTNLRQLKNDVQRGRATNVQEAPGDEDDVVALDWVPAGPLRFNDCDVAVKVVARRGSLLDERLEEILHDVDGVVVVVDATLAAEEENKRVVSLVREALSKATPPRSVVVQLNKSDLADALSRSDLVERLETNEWPVVTASAVHGEGVVETLEAALAGVLDSMKERGTTAQVPRPDHTPLLDALRQILRETVTEQMAVVERDTVARVTEVLADRLARTDRAVGELQTAIASATERARSDREQMTAAIAGLKRSLDAVASDPKRAEAREHLAALATEVGRLHEKVDAMKSAFLPAIGAAAGLPARIGALETSMQREIREAVGARLTRLDDSVQVLHVDAGESFARTDAHIKEIQSGLTELLDELKRRKKGWFS